jgi:hypothetical protein
VSDMNWELDSILEQSISQIAEGKARVESCLLAYPAQADQLKPLLLASEELWAVPKPVISPAASARIESQLFEAAAASGLVRRERKPLVLPRLRSLIVLPRWRWAYSAVAAMVVVVLLMTTTFVGAANALPGSPFYAVKLATEEAWLWVAPARDEPALHLRFAQRRLDEYKELAEQGVYDESVLDAMVAHVDAALDGIEELPPAIALVLLDEVAEVVAEQRVVLTAMLADLPAASRLQVDRILGDAFSQITRVEALRWAASSYETDVSPELTLTLVPTSTAEPGQILVATFTPTSRLALEETEEVPVPTSTEVSGGTEPGEATTTVSTATPEPPTKTPTPPPAETPVEPTPEEPEPTKKTPPGLTKTPLPPGLITRTPAP